MTLDELHSDAGFALREAPVADVTLGTVLSSRANARGHTRYQTREVKAAVENGMWLARITHAREHVHGSDFVLVRWTRLIGPNERHFDSDNATTAVKSIRDGFAKAIGINDGDTERVRYLPVEQVRGPKSGLRVRIYRKELT